MALLDYFKPVLAMTAEEVREFLKQKDPDDYNLIDVRQPKEYERGHLAGARLMPVGDLTNHLNELDRSKPTITYCGSGVRSRAAAAILSDAGFENAFNMQGGIKAWEGLVAGGPPEAGMAWFGDAVRPDELTVLAWMLEEGSRSFYARLVAFLTDEDARQLFSNLSKAEENHKRTLAELHRTFSNGKAVEGSLPPGTHDEIMEGGLKVDEALLWAREKDAVSVLEFAISLEMNAYDLYLKMERKMEGDAKKVFLILADEEKKHLDRLASLLEKKV